jgi:hypothetical protein
MDQIQNLSHQELLRLIMFMQKAGLPMTGAGFQLLCLASYNKLTNKEYK